MKQHDGSRTMTKDFNQVEAGRGDTKGTLCVCVCVCVCVCGLC